MRQETKTTQMEFSGKTTMTLMTMNNPDSGLTYHLATAGKKKKKKKNEKERRAAWYVFLPVL